MRKIITILLAALVVISCGIRQQYYVPFVEYTTNPFGYTPPPDSDGTIFTKKEKSPAP